MRISLLCAGLLVTCALASPAGARSQTATATGDSVASVLFSDGVGLPPAEPAPIGPALFRAGSLAGTGPVSRVVGPAFPRAVTLSPTPRRDLGRWRRYSNWGMAIGGAVGLAYGLAYPSNSEFLSLSPVIETAVGAGIGVYVATAVYLVRSVR